MVVDQNGGSSALLCAHGSLAPRLPPAGESPPGAEPGSRTWQVRQILDDPEGNHDWSITAVVDLTASDAEGTAVVHITAVGPAA